MMFQLLLSMCVSLGAQAVLRIVGQSATSNSKRLLKHHQIDGVLRFDGRLVVFYMVVHLQMAQGLMFLGVYFALCRIPPCNIQV